LNLSPEEFLYINIQEQKLVVRKHKTNKETNFQIFNPGASDSHL
jgi:hypothetical protein